MATLIVVATARPEGDESRQRYVQQVMPLLTGIGGQPVKRLAVTDAVSGTARPESVIVMDFPEAEPLRALFQSAEYETLLPLRNAGFAQIEILIAEDL